MSISEKIHKYLEVNDSEKAFNQTINIMLNHIKDLSESLGEDSGQDHPIAKEIISKIKYQSLIEEVWIPFMKDAFTEDEMDRLIVLTSDPVFRKLAGFTSTVMALSNDWSAKMMKEILKKHFPEMEI